MLYKILTLFLLFAGLVWTPADWTNHRARWHRLVQPTCMAVVTAPAPGPGNLTGLGTVEPEPKAARS